MGDPNSDRRKSERKPMQANLEFNLYLDVFKAKTIDVSETGIRFHSDTPIIIQLQYNDGGKCRRRHALLVWAERKGDKGITYGFEFVPEIKI